MNKKSYTVFLTILYALMIIIYAWLFPKTLDNGWASLGAFIISAITCVVVLVLGLLLTLFSRRKIELSGGHWVFVVIVPLIVTFLFFAFIFAFGKLSGC